jgi:hypothetical protein
MCKKLPVVINKRINVLSHQLGQDHAATVRASMRCGRHYGPPAGELCVTCLATQIVCLSVLHTPAIFYQN